MTASRQIPSLRGRFRRLSIRWSLVGLALTVATVVPAMLLVVKHSSERQAEVMATALSQAFRPMILQQQIRETKLQMEGVAKLHPGESVDVLDENFKPILLDRMDDRPEKYCRTPSGPCWTFGDMRVSITIPVYFDEDTKKELFGYVALKLKPTVNWFEVLALIFGGTLIFWLQVRGISASFQKESTRIERTLAYWKKLVDDPKLAEKPTEEEWLYAEFLPLHQSVTSLQSRVSTLEGVAAENAAAKAKIDIVRGIGHDLKTPLAQLAKFFAIFVRNVEEKTPVNSAEVSRIEGIMSRMGSLIRQVTNLDRRSEPSKDTDLSLWLQAYRNEIEADPEFLGTKTRIKFDCKADGIHAAIHELDLFRLVDNLVRNAIEAMPSVPEPQNEITISLRENAGHPVIEVADNGAGIPKDIQNKIFDLDFTTKAQRGTGLGLGIVKKICHDSGIGLRLSSTEGVGTTFTMEFFGRALGSDFMPLREEVI